LAAALLDAAIADPNLSRVKDAWQGLEWRLCRQPGDALPRRNGYFFYKQLGIPSLNIPTIMVLYRFDFNTVTVYAIDISSERA
jgi:hypothetical protein